MAARRLGQIFVDLGYINDDQLEMLVEEQAQSQGGKLIGRIAMEMGLVTDDELIASLGEQFNLQTIDLDGVTPPEDARKALSDSMAQLYRVIPLQLNDNVLTLATCDPQNLAMQDELRRFLGTVDPNNTITVKVKRGEEELEKSIRLGAYPSRSRHAADMMSKSGRRDGFSEVIPHDADLDPENCGSPIFDLEGKFVGLNIARNSRVRSYAIPRSIVKALVDKNQ